MKIAPIMRAFKASGNFETLLVHTGQHYDENMSKLFFDELGIPEPDHALGIGPGTPLHQLAEMLRGIEAILAGERPDVVLVYGDTTTTLAGALAASKAGGRLAHVEAGLRSFDRSMPEEQNRVVTDHLSDLLFCPTDAAVSNLMREGITRGVHRVGDVMFDAHLLFAQVASARPGPERWGLGAGEYLLLTVHRAAATDSRAALLDLVAVLEALDAPALFPVHPRTRHRLQDEGLWERAERVPGLRLLPPIGYLDFTRALLDARAVLTDSGGVQKEAFFAGVPCLTLRTETEWVETVEAGFNRLVAMDAGAVREALSDLTLPQDRPDLYGDGDAAGATAEILLAES